MDSNTWANQRSIQLLLYLYPQLFQLRVAHWRGCVDHQIHGPGGLGEWNHFPQTVGSGQDHHDAVETESNPAMRRRAVLQRLQKESETRAGFIFCHPQRMKDLLLNILPMNTNRA